MAAWSNAKSSAEMRKCTCCRGYSTEAEKEAAKNTKGVRLINLTEFQELLKWGILMGVSICCSIALMLRISYDCACVAVQHLFGESSQVVILAHAVDSLAVIFCLLCITLSAAV